jgi:hypothetical protein
MSDEIGSKVSVALDAVVDDFAKSIEKLDQQTFSAQKGKIKVGKMIADAVHETIEEAGGPISQSVIGRLQRLDSLTLKDAGEIMNTLDMLADDLLRDAIETGTKSIGSAGGDANAFLNQIRSLYSGSAVVRKLSLDVAEALGKLSTDLDSPDVFAKVLDSVSTPGQKALRSTVSGATTAAAAVKKLDWKKILMAGWDPIGTAFPRSKVIWSPPDVGSFRRVINTVFLLPPRASLWLLYASIAFGVANESGENMYDFFDWILSDKGEAAIQGMKNVFVAIELAPDAFKVLSEQFNAYEPQEGAVGGALGSLQALGGYAKSDWMEKIMTPIETGKELGKGALRGLASASTGVDIENAEALKTMCNRAAAECTSAAASYQTLKDNIESGNYELALNAVDASVISSAFRLIWEEGAPEAFFGGPLGGSR